MNKPLNKARRDRRARDRLIERKMEGRGVADGVSAHELVSQWAFKLRTRGRRTHVTNDWEVVSAGAMANDLRKEDVKSSRCQ